MDEQRKGEIAYVLLKRDLTQDLRIHNLSDASEVKKRLGQLSKETGIPKEDLLEFAKIAGEEILMEANSKLQMIQFSEKGIGFSK
ncbi:MAG: hypothetical protein US98_C0032G0004 [Parcubacteria group bacterium GW2011_GWC1_38_6]|nr:MAG: hypothetical protein US98_C0032G0004 [Parcubacteria group bacterium GW2011_GWC1_38_6]